MLDPGDGARPPVTAVDSPSPLTTLSLLLAESLSPLSTEASFDLASSARSSVLSLEARIEVELIPRLESNAVTSSSHVTSAVCILVDYTQRCVPTFVTTARRHARMIDKLLEAKADECGDGCTILASFLRQIDAGEGEVVYTEDSVRSVGRILEGATEFPPESLLLSPGSDECVALVRKSSRIVTGIYPALSTALHTPWLTRGEGNPVTITAVDDVGVPVVNITAEDVECSFIDSVGWDVSFSSVEAHHLTLTVIPAADCSDTGVLCIGVWGNNMTVPLKVCS